MINMQLILTLLIFTTSHHSHHYGYKTVFHVPHYTLSPSRDTLKKHDPDKEWMDAHCFWQHQTVCLKDNEIRSPTNPCWHVPEMEFVCFDY